MLEQEILNELRTLNRNFERLFLQGYAVDGPKEAATTHALAFAQFQHDYANAKTSEEKKKIRMAWNNSQKRREARR